MLPDMFIVECWDVNHPIDRRKVGFPIEELGCQARTGTEVE
jgi:hypothetical protein